MKFRFRIERHKKMEQVRIRLNPDESTGKVIMNVIYPRPPGVHGKDGELELSFTPVNALMFANDLKEAADKLHALEVKDLPYIPCGPKPESNPAQGSILKVVDEGPKEVKDEDWNKLKG